MKNDNLRHFINSERGSTFIEILIYAAIVAGFLQVVILFFHATLDATDRIAERNELLANQEFIDQKIKWLFGQASVVSFPALSSSSSVRFTLSGASSTLYPATFTFTSSSIFLYIPSVATSSLALQRIQIVSFKAEHLSNAVATSSVRVSFHLRSVALPSIESSTTLTYTLPY